VSNIGTKYVRIMKQTAFWRRKNEEYILTYLLTSLLTYSMVQSPSWTANWFLQLVKKFSAFHGNPRFFTALTSVRHLSLSWASPIPVHIPTSHLLEIYPNIIHPSMPRSPQWSLSLRFPHQDPIHSPHLTYTRHMPSPSHSSPFYHPHNIGWGIKTKSIYHV